MTDLFQIRTYWKQWVEARIVTEDGVFAEGQIPEDYSGSELTVEVSQRILFADTGGHITELRLDDLYNVMDNERHTGVGAEIRGDDGTVIETIPASGDSSHLVQWVVRYNPLLPQAQRNNAAAVKAIADEQKTLEG